MTRSRFHWLLALLLFAPAPAGAQQKPDKPPFELPPADRGTQLFRGLLDFHKIEPVADPRAVGDYRKLIVIFIGEPRGHVMGMDMQELTRAALSGGGAVLFAAEGNFSVSSYLNGGVHVGIDNNSVRFVLSTAGGDVRSPRGPVVPVLPNPTAVGPEFELFTPYQNVEVTSATHLTFAARRPPELGRVIATFPPNAEAMGGALPPIPFAAAGVGDAKNPFRCLAVADTDLFSNKLLYASGRLQNANDNLKFSNGLVQWLKGPQGRDRCLFVENGQVVTKFDEVKYSAIPVSPDMPGPPVPAIDPFDAKFQQSVTDFVNNGVAQVQDDDRLVGPLTNDPQKKAYVYAALAVVVAVIAYLLLRFRSLAGRFRAAFRPLPKDPHMLGPDAAVGSLEHRRLELLRGGNYAAPVRSYVRQLFEDRGLPPGYDRPKLPPIDFDVRNPDFLRRSVRTLWAEAHAAAPINYGRWKELEPMLAALRAAADDDRWRFAPGDEGDA